jgi:hypothetical protein
MNRAIDHACRILLSVLLLVVGGSKVLTGHAAATIWPAWVTVWGGIVEIIVALLLWSALRKAACVAVVAIGAAAIVFTWLAPSGASCGCLGTLHVLSNREHIMLGATLGLLATSLLETAPARLRGAPADNKP